MGADQVMTPIDLSKYEVGQRFRTRGGYEAVIIDKHGGLTWCGHTDLGKRPHSLNGLYTRSPAPQYDLLKPIYRVPARTRRLPKPSPMPTGYEKQWPHLYQMGGGV